MKVPVQWQDVPPGRPKWWQSLQRIFQLVTKAINGNIEFGNPTAGPVNINGVFANPTTPGAPNTDFTVTHNLGRNIGGYLIIGKNAACDIYTSPTANPNPTTQFIFRATVGTVNVFMFIF